VNIFITGGTKGIGAAIAERYLKKGHRVGVCARNIPRDRNSNISYFQADITDSDQIDLAVESFENLMGPIDVFYANAGIGVSKKTSKLQIERDIELTRANVLGFLNSVNSIIPRFLARKKGHFVTTSSISSLVGLPGNAAYCASKSFLSTYSQSLARDLKKSNVKLTIIQPGYIETDHTKDNNHPMPFLMKADQAALKIINAVEKNKLVLSFPFPFAQLTHIVGTLPQALQSYLFQLIKYK